MIEPVPSLATSRCRLLEIPADEVLLAITPMMKANAPTLPSHTIRLPRSVRSACAVGEESSRRRGAALSRAGSTPVPMSRPAAIRAATTSSSTVAASGEQQHERLGAGEGAQFLGPPERRHPAQPAGAGRGVGDHPQQPGTARRPRRRARARSGVSGRAGWRARPRRRTPARPRRSRARARPSRRRAGPPGRNPANSASPRITMPAAIAASAARYAVRSPDRPGEHELHPARVLLGCAARAPRRAARTRRRRSPASRRRARRCSRRR